jgi:hypothetical protein
MATATLRVLQPRWQAFGAELLATEQSCDACGGTHRLLSGANEGVHEHEEELFVSGHRHGVSWEACAHRALTCVLCSVVWSSGRVVRKRYTSSAPVLQARWSAVLRVARAEAYAGSVFALPRERLHRAAPLPAALRPADHPRAQRYAMAVQRRGAWVAHARLLCAGDTHSIPVPEGPLSPWVTPFGLLLQRLTASGAELQAVLSPLDESTAVALPPGSQLLWSDAARPLVRPAQRPTHARALTRRPRRCWRARPTGS